MRVRQAAKASGIRAVERAVAILRTFSSGAPELSVSELGRAVGLHKSTVHRLLGTLAHLPDASMADVIERRGLRRFTSKTITSPKELRDHCALIRQQGYALDTGEHEELIQCAAAAIYDHTGKAVAAVSITSVAAAMDQHRVAEHASLVQQAARKISEGLGASLSIRHKEGPAPIRPVVTRPSTPGR